MRFIIFALLSLAMLSCQKSEGTVTPVSQEPAKLTVAVQLPVRRSLNTDASLTAEFRPYQQVDLYAKTSGYLRKITVDVGSRLKAGDLIAQLESPELQAEVDQAAAARARAESDLVRAKAELQRYESVAELTKTSSQRLLNVNKTEAGLVAQQEIDEAMSKRSAAESHLAAARAEIVVATRQVDAAKAAEERAKLMLEYTRVTAPFAGVVIKRFADPGALIQAGVSSNTQTLPLVRLADIDRLRLAANVPEVLTGTLKPGATVTVRVPALQMTFPARLSRFTGNVQQNSRTTEVEIDVPNPNRTILPGMVADVVLPVSGRSDALTVPVQAISNLGGNRYVLVASPDGTLEERQLQTGIEGATEVEVLSGLADTDRIVVSSRTLLRPGMKVGVKLEGPAL